MPYGSADAEQSLLAEITSLRAENAALKAEVEKLKSTNSRYMAALTVYLEWAGVVSETGAGSAYDFHKWLSQRLKPEEPACT